MCGGDESIYNSVLPQLQAMGKASFHLGGVGQGTKMKLIVNMVMGTMMGAFSEGMALCDATGISQDSLLQVILDTLLILIFYCKHIYTHVHTLYVCRRNLYDKYL